VEGQKVLFLFVVASVALTAKKFQPHFVLFPIPSKEELSSDREMPGACDKQSSIAWEHTNKCIR